MFSRLLDYWYALEFFQPNWPVSEKDDINLLKKELPWLSALPNPKIQISYDIYLGCATTVDLISWCLNKLKLIEKDSKVERDLSKCCLCAFKVNENGCYVADSFAVSSFVWALGTMVKSKDFGIKLNLDDLRNFQRRFDIALSEKESEFSLEELRLIFMQVCKEICVEPDVISPAMWARKKKQYQKKNERFPELETTTELMSSYYIKDISRVRKEPNHQIKKYAEALYNKLPERIRIDTDILYMKKHLEAGCFPRGIWPSVFSPSLMQQLAINLAVSELGIFSVNGPPGTGKTTLLKEIIASNIVQRSALLAGYANPDDAFRKYEFKSPPDKFNRTFYRPDDVLTGFGMLIASNNNAAVENISVELPKVMKKDRSGYFTDIENTDKTYFSDIASALLGEPAWGLISARLGKKKNLIELKDRLWKAKDGNTLKKYYDQPIPDWESARQSFLAAWEAVEREREIISKVQKNADKYAQSIRLEQEALSELEELQEKVAGQSRLLSEQQAILDELESTYLLYQQNEKALKSGASGLKRLFAANDPVVREWKNVKQQCDEVLIAMTRQRKVVQTQVEKLKADTQQLCRQEELFKKAKEQSQVLGAALETERERFASNYADNIFWQDISSNEKSQSACPWTDRVYDNLREELFYRSLMLQKAFVLGSKSVKQNLTRLFTMWEGGFSAEDRASSYGCLLNTFFFVVPVISTTFASVHSFLDGVQPSELGILVVDEAGQATPQSALGALWRTRKAIIVGDPLQVEPIMTTPLELCKRFADDNDLPGIYRIPELSVQMLADAQNPYGGLQQMTGEPLWLGCPLVIHRRCIEPIFSMSNNVAYCGRMFCKTAPPSTDKQFLLEKSVWFDISAREVGNKNHTVPRQVDLVLSLIEKAIIKFNVLPNIYIITPFKSVERSLKQKLKELLNRLLPDTYTDSINDWLDSNCGTIHTFQGKEADEVLLVLGCDSQQGMGAARWVGQKPNIVNVAVSRAKYRIGIIGSYALWNSIPYVQQICEMIDCEIVADSL